MLLAVVGFFNQTVSLLKELLFSPTLVKVCSQQLLLPRIEAKTDQEEARAMAQLKGKFSLSHFLFSAARKSPQPEWC